MRGRGGGRGNVVVWRRGIKAEDEVQETFAGVDSFAREERVRARNALLRPMASLASSSCDARAIAARRVAESMRGSTRGGRSVGGGGRRVGRETSLSSSDDPFPFFLEGSELCVSFGEFFSEFERARLFLGNEG
jgi:hypothetical protein